MATQEAPTEAESSLTVVDSRSDFPRVTLEDPTDSRYVVLAGAVDDPTLPFPPVYLADSDRKRSLLAECKRRCRDLNDREWVVEATAFDALLRPPGRGEYLERTDEEVHVADFDVAVLVEVKADAGRRLERDPAYRTLASAIEETARDSVIVTGTNARRIGPVDHDRNGVFLFNYFFAEDVERNLAVWEYTSGWFQSETGLDNSTVIRPDDPDRSEYALINHCRWDGLREVLPALVLKRSFRSYVLENFAANRVAPMPILYRLA